MQSVSTDKYNSNAIELKWAEKWQKMKLYRAIDGSKKKKAIF